jgi:hypothetical protein
MMTTVWLSSMMSKSRETNLNRAIGEPCEKNAGKTRPLYKTHSRQYMEDGKDIKAKSQ